MPLSAGTRFGPFEIVSPLGAGGMGEVYRARDTRLNRGVAIKVLADALTPDADRIARFKREAQMLAALSHPGIAAIHGFEEANGVHALVLELVEGPTLAERLERGPIPPNEALPIALQIAEALEAAHELGIIHRDLKPANIKVTDEGVVKVLDFGLAKALEGDATKSAIDVSQSPTLSFAATRMGVILGTAAYMAPEQARGKPADRRADIWAFGCVLYEMLTGRRPFEGEVVTDTMAAILRGEPDWNALPASTPGVIRRLLRRCLEKDRRDRLQAIGDARLEIKEAMRGGDDGAQAPVAVQRDAGTGVLPMTGAAVVAALLAGAAVWMMKPADPATGTVVTRSLLGINPFDRRSPTDGVIFEQRRRDRTSIAISPDGRTLIIRALGDRGEQLFVRPLDSLEPTPLAGTEGADSPFFSPDGAWVGFRVGSELKKMQLAGGVPTTIARIPDDNERPYGVSWGSNDTILFATVGIWQVPAAGGEPRAVTTPASSENRHVLPQLLPGGNALLFTISKTAFRWDDAQIAVRALDTGAQKVLIENGADARYVPSGHIIFLRASTLMAAPFDLGRLEVTGSPVPLVEGVMQAVNTGNSRNDSGAGQVAVADNGTLVYATGGPAPAQVRALAWIDRGGNIQPMDLPDRPYGTPRIAPDGGRIAVTLGPDSERRVWVYDLMRGSRTPVTSPDDFAFYNIWSPDGNRIAFAAASTDLDARSADGTGSPQRLHESPTYASPSSWSSDGRLLAFAQGGQGTASDIWIRDFTSNDQPARAFLQTAANETFPEFSPDGRWLAYTSDQSGEPEVYVQPYPGPGTRIQVSNARGSAPAWARGGSELYYIQPASGVVYMMAAGITTAPAAITADAPRKLFEGRFGLTSPVRGYDVTPDGNRFLMVLQKPAPPQPPIELVLVGNWFEELKQRVPAK